MEAALSWPDAIRTWHDGSNNVVILSVPVESALAEYDTTASALQIPHRAIYEPDLDDQLTAISFAPVPGAARLLASLPLWGKEAVTV